MFSKYNTLFRQQGYIIERNWIFLPRVWTHVKIPTALLAAFVSPREAEPWAYNQTAMHRPLHMHVLLGSHKVNSRLGFKAASGKKVTNWFKSKLIKETHSLLLSTRQSEPPELESSLREHQTLCDHFPGNNQQFFFTDSQSSWDWKGPLRWSVQAGSAGAGCLGQYLIWHFM